MLDENLPTFYFKPSPDNNPLKSFLYFTHNGSEPAPEYLFQKVDPALPQSKNKYASALGDAVAPDVIFGEVLIEPEFQQPTLSAAEIRAQNGTPPLPVPLIPDSFTIQLYNPDQQVVVRGEKSNWTGKESWEFEMPQQSFRRPSASKLDRQQSDENANALASLAPRIMFRWKRDGKFTRDMTCYMTGTSVNGRKSKDPDITVAMFKHHNGGGGRGEQRSSSHSVTIYEPNLQRVDVEDRKGLEVVILLGAEVIREIYLQPSRDSFNVMGAPLPGGSGNRRKNSRPVLAAGAASSSSPTAQAHVMTSAIGNGNGRATPGAKSSSPTTAAHKTRPLASSSTPHLPSSSSSTPGAQQQQNRRQSQGQAAVTAAIDAETRRLRTMVEQEEREEREKRERAEERRTKKMLEQEEREIRQQRETEVARETERLRREYGVEGQDFGPRPSLPPRPAGTGTPGPQSGGGSSLHPHGNNGGGGGGSYPPPPRPSSAEPRPRLGNGISRLFHPSSPQPGSSSSSNQQGGRRRGKSSDGPGMLKKKSTLF